MKKLNLNKVLSVVNITIAGLLIVKALFILLGYKTLNEPSQIAILLLAGLMFLQDGKDELSKLENKENK